MHEGNDRPAHRPDTGDGTSPDPVAPGDRDLPWKATPERRDLWGPARRPLQGTVHPPSETAVDRPRRRGGLLWVGAPLLAGGAAGLTSLVLGLGNVIAGPLDTVGVALGVGALVAGGSGALARALRPKPALLSPVGPDVPETTRETLEGILEAAARTRERTTALRERASDPAARLALDHIDSLLERIETLVGSETIQARRPYDGDVTMLEGMATRYLPDLVDAAEDTIGFLASFAGAARQEALENLGTIDQQLSVLDEGLERIEADIVAGVSRDLDVHAEFLRSRFADQHLNPIIDV
ncbi:hypothetical protein ACFQS2_01260 [Brachybacterium sp. GCM10030267]|uniref:hypothetical protein n=1 Tax=Brachybacterium sp. GCM10030267 TaxID=3273381 RepID=UPI0036133949